MSTQLPTFLHRFSTLAAANIALLSLAGCASSGPTAAPSPQVADAAWQGRVYLYHLRQHGDDKATPPFGQSLDSESISNATGIERIGLERSPCYGTCSTYILMYCKNGDAVYCGDAAAERIGCFLGTLDISDFARLALIVEDLGVEAMNHTYLTWETDAASTYFIVQRADRIATVENYARSGPPRLLALESVLLGTGDKIQWQPIDLATTPAARSCLDLTSEVLP